MLLILLGRPHYLLQHKAAAAQRHWHKHVTVMASVLNQSWSLRTISQGARFGKGYFFSLRRPRLLKRDIVLPKAKIAPNSPLRSMCCKAPRRLPAKTFSPLRARQMISPEEKESTPPELHPQNSA